jgi:hypothetical protein
MSLLEGVHCDHLGMEVASEAWEEDGISPLPDYLPLRVDQHSAHTVVARLRGRQGLSTRENPEILVFVMRALCRHVSKTGLQVR